MKRFLGPLRARMGALFKGNWVNPTAADAVPDKARYRFPSPASAPAPERSTAFPTKTEPMADVYYASRTSKQVECMNVPHEIVYTFNSKGQVKSVTMPEDQQSDFQAALDLRNDFADKVMASQKELLAEMTPEFESDELYSAAADQLRLRERMMADMPQPRTVEEYLAMATPEPGYKRPSWCRGTYTERDTSEYL